MFEARCNPGTYIMTFQVYTELPPFSNVTNDTTVILQVMKGMRPARPSKRLMSDELWGIVEWCWSQQYSDRPSMCVVVEIMTAGNFGY